jgi:PAS domain S-box-containing protein
VTTLTGYSADEVLAAGSFAPMLTPAARATAANDLAADLLRPAPEDRAAAQRRANTSELEHVRKDGTTVWTEVRASFLLDDDGRRVGIVGATRDISDRKRVEVVLAERTQALERSNGELQHFAYVVSHDLQEPLRTMTSYVQLLARRYRGKLDQGADEFIGFAVDAASRMQGLINDLLEYSRVQTRGKAPVPTDTEALFAIVLANLHAAIDESGAVVTHDPLPSVVADESQLTRVFQNLVGNALKYHPKDRKPVVHVSARRGTAEWIFSVRDNGIGIDPKNFGRLFIMFSRLHTREEFPGTGAGLAICKRIVTRHGGRIWVESEPGEGSTFAFSLPYSAPAETTP